MSLHASHPQQGALQIEVPEGIRPFMRRERDKDARVVAGNIVHANHCVCQQPECDDRAEQQPDESGPKLLNAEEHHDNCDCNAIDRAPAKAQILARSKEAHKLLAKSDHVCGATSKVAMKHLHNARPVRAESLTWSHSASAH